MISNVFNYTQIPSYGAVNPPKNKLNSYSKIIEDFQVPEGKPTKYYYDFGFLYEVYIYKTHTVRTTELLIILHTFS